MHGSTPAGADLSAAFGQAAAALPADPRDRPLDADLTAAQRLIDTLARQRSEREGGRAAQIAGPR